jgi:hypothetical protein
VARAVGLTGGAHTAGWTPIRVHQGEPPVVEWCWTDGITFDEPFFTQTIERALKVPFSLLFRPETSIDELEGLEPGLEPNGFVFHVSRCGSTLISGMLAAVPEHLVISEPIPVDNALRLPLPRADKVRLLRAIVSALGRRRRGDERAYVLKLDAWSACHLGVVREAFPNVPWIFVSREPIEVLASHFRGRGAHMVPGALDPGLFGIGWDSLAHMPPEEYCARVLAAICRAGLDHRDDRSLFIDYRDLPDAVFDRVVAHFTLDCGEPERARMAEVTRFDAKNRHLYFSDDRQARLAEVSPALREAAARFVQPVYEELLAC